jgi:hypothetical protein
MRQENIFHDTTPEQAPHGPRYDAGRAVAGTSRAKGPCPRFANLGPAWRHTQA